MSVINGITVVAGQDTPDNDAGVVELLGSLSGRYFCDDNGDGLDNDSDLGGEGPGVEGVRVDLLDENGDPTGQFTVTDADGNYSFANLPAGSYGVRFESGQLDKELTIQDANGNANDDIDSDAMSDTVGFAVIPNIIVLPGQNTPDNDIGITPANADPEAEDVAAAVCADDMATINLLDAVFDVDGDALTLTISDADETAGVGESITLESGGVVTLNANGTVTFNPNGAYDDLVIRDSVMDQFQFTADDGNGGTATANADIKVCGALNTIDTINEGLPDTATVTYRFSNDGAFQVDIDSDDPRLDTDGFTIDVFCVDFDTLFINGAQVETNIYASVDMQPDATPDQIDALPDGIVPNEENLDLVNWILNQDFRNMDNGDGTGETYTGGEIQDAIWFLTNDRPIPDDTVFNPGGQANSQEIVDFALNDINMDGVADGGAEGFVAGEGDLVGVILAPALDANAVDVDTGELIPLDSQPLQPFIVGIRFEDLEEACDCVL
jgi:VCBS repeat-containing protein